MDLKNGNSTVSIGICAYNEEANISKLLDSILAQELSRVTIIEIIVVSSNSSDSTDQIVKDYSKRDNRISLITEDQRNGKASAVNLFLQQASGEICIIQSADTICIAKTIESICSPILDDSNVGAVGGRPIPRGTRGIFLPFANRLIWHLHSRVSLRNPKLGEISAHRNIIDSIPLDATSDDTYLEYAIKEKGLKVAYSHDAVIYNQGPGTLSEYIEQRTRWRGAQIRVQKDTGYVSASGKQRSVNYEVARYCLFRPWTIPFVFPICFIELYCISKAKRMLAQNDDSFVVWDSVSSTKKLD